ncbi:Cyclic nucleotide-binding domain-containing protein [Mariprofundus ferrinatatus]|uniref:Cyclic nucleotide-binding domain-containing protein n=1 Tax=Mariprofundus ferrinatatus TaxID=1921087 RepID=A0A2K8L2Q8_9PROT|nr:cyclic nucleotide-binding domain-containing protein [Mariprofundus ferrinatatus]ATX81577.1 Cyclic nucleotide-binding domain-containing protein [Mariprofundus ferrinatatus]
MDLLSKEHIDGVSRHDRLFILKLAAGGIFTALGAYKLGFNIELSFAALVFVPAIGMFFTYLKQEADSNILRWLSIFVFSALFGMFVGSYYLAIAVFLLMEGATHHKSITRCSDAKWMRIVRAESSMDDLHRLIVGHSLFHSLSVETRQSLAEQSTVMEVEPGAALIRKGEFNYYLFLLAKGEATVIRNGENVATLRSGDIFGEVSAVGLSLPVADVVAKTDALAFAIPVDALWAVVSENPQFAVELRELGMSVVDMALPAEEAEAVADSHQLFDDDEEAKVNALFDNEAALNKDDGKAA